MKTKSVEIFVMAVALAAAMTATSVQATLVPISVPPGDWGQQWQEQGVNFTEVDFYITSAGTTFQTPGLNSFSDGSWNGIYTSPTLAVAVGSVLNNLYFSSTFNDPQVPVTFNFYAWNGNTLVDSAVVVGDNAGWTISGGAPAEASPASAVVPEPSSIIAGLLLLLPFGASAFRIIRRKQDVA